MTGTATWIESVRRRHRWAPRAAVQDQFAEQKREAAGREDRVRRLQLGERPPADGGDTLCVQLCPRVLRTGFEWRRANEEVRLGLPVPANPELEHVGSRPNRRSELDPVEPGFLD